MEFLKVSNDLLYIRNFNLESLNVLLNGFLSGVYSLVKSIDEQIIKLKTEFNEIESKSSEFVSDDDIGEITDVEYLNRVLKYSNKQEIYAYTLIKLYNDMYNINTEILTIKSYLISCAAQKNLLDTIYISMDNCNPWKITLFNSTFQPFLSLLLSWINKGSNLHKSNILFEIYPQFLEAIKSSLESAHYFLLLIFQYRSFNDNQHLQLLKKLSENRVKSICTYDGSIPLKIYMERNVLNHLNNRLLYIHNELVNHLFTNYNLDKIIHIFKDLFLGGKENVLSLFSTNLFNSIHNSSYIPTVMMIKNLLCQSIKDELPYYDNSEFFNIYNIEVSMNLAGIPNDNHIQMLDNLRISYKTQFPLNIIITDNIMEQYSTILTYLMKFRRVYYELNNVQRLYKQNMKEIGKKNKEIEYSSITTDHDYVQNKTFTIFSFIRSFYSSVLEIILFESCDTLIEKLKQSKDINEMKEIYSNYLKKIREKILLKNQTGILMQTISEILNQSLVYVREYENWINFIEERLLDHSYEFYYSNMKVSLDRVINNCKFLFEIFKTKLKTNYLDYLEYIILKTDLNNTYLIDIPYYLDLLI